MKPFASAILAFALVAVLAPEPQAQSAAPPARERLDGIAAVVNDDMVLESDVEEQLYLFLARAQAQPDSAMVDTLRTQILDQLIDEKLIVAEARRQGLTVPEADVGRQVDQAIAEAKERMGGEEGFAEQLRKENLTEPKLREKYRAEVERQMLAQRLVEKQFPRKRGGVTAAEAEAYFKAHREEFPKVPAELKMQVVQIPPEADSATDVRARARILDARKRILAGEKFAKVAADLSEDTNTARGGGDLGFLPRGALDGPLDDAVFSLAPGRLSDPVRSAVGWHLVEVLERDTVKTHSGRDSLDAGGRPLLEAHVRHILARAPIEEADIERARALAERVRDEAERGADFGMLVKRYSQYRGRQDDNGDIGYVSLGTLPGNIRAGLETLPVGGVSEVLENPIGFNVFKVNDIKPERMYELEEIRDELPDAVEQMQRRERYDGWIKGLRAKAHIEIRNP